MPRFEDYRSDPEVRDIVERLLKRFPQVFEGFAVGDIFFIMTQTKKLRCKHPIKVRSIPYPHYVASGMTYVFETFETKWLEFNKKQRNLAVFHAMCSIPIGGFDPASTTYGRVLKADYQIFRYEYAASGGVPDWTENDSARDPMEIDPADVSVASDDDDDPPPLPMDGDDPIPEEEEKSGKFPVTAEDIDAAATAPEEIAS